MICSLEFLKFIMKLCISTFLLSWAALTILVDGKRSYLHVNIAKTNMMNARLQSISDKTSLRHRSVGEKKKIQDKVASSAAARDSRYVNRELLSKHELVVQLFTRTRGDERWVFNKEKILNATMSSFYRQEVLQSPSGCSFLELLKLEMIGSGVGPPKIKRELIAAQPQLVNIRSRDLEIGYQMDIQEPIITLKGTFKEKLRSKGRLFTLAREQQLFDRVTIPSKLSFTPLLSSQLNNSSPASLWLNTKEFVYSRRSKLMLLAIESFVLQQIVNKDSRNITVVADGSLFHKLESSVTYASAGVVFLADAHLHDALSSITRSVTDMSQPQRHHQFLNQTLLVSIIPHFDWISSPLEAELAAISAAGLISILIQRCFDHYNHQHRTSYSNTPPISLSWQCWSDSKSAVRSWRNMKEASAVVNQGRVSELVAAIANASSTIPKWGAGHPESNTQDFSRWSTHDWCSWYADRLSNLAADSIIVSDTSFTDDGHVDNEESMSGISALRKQIESKSRCRLKDRAIAISMTELLAFFANSSCSAGSSH